MAEKDLNWKFAEEMVVEPAAIQTARQHSLELGIDPVSPGVGAQLAVLAGASSSAARSSRSAPAPASAGSGC